MSWPEIRPECGFTRENLPYGIFRSEPGAPPRAGVALGDSVLDLHGLWEAGLFRGCGVEDPGVFTSGALNEFMDLGPTVWERVRSRLQELADEGRHLEVHATPGAEVQMQLPFRVADYVDFYSSREHATNVGTMFRGPERALHPNWRHLPVGYHGRSSTVFVSGSPILRPQGQRLDDDETPSFGPSRRMDFELEMGFVVGQGTSYGRSLTPAEAEKHIFGLVLLNDWSARDIQRWEYVPLGPFLGKSFATTISAWVIPLKALEPFRVSGPEQDPPVLPYLRTEGDRGWDIALEVELNGEVISRSNFRHLYWSMGQQLAHMTSNGTILRTGDLYGSGTISGPQPGSYGSMLELAWNGTRPVQLRDGSTRVFLQDGDTVTLRGRAQKEGLRVAFGEATGRLEGTA